MQRKIVKVKLTDTNCVHVGYLEYPAPGEDETALPDKVNREGEHEAHPDLVQLFADLRIHMATVCEQAPYTQYEEDTNMLDRFKVTQVTIAGDDEHEGIVITGQRQLNHEKVLNLNTPFVKLNPDHSDYAYVQSMAMTVDALLQEADQYLNGKFAPSRQLNMFDDLNKAIDDDGGAESKPKKGRKVRKLGKNNPLQKAMGDDVELSVEVDD